MRRPTTIVAERSIFCTIIKEGWKLVFEGYEGAETCFLYARLNFSFHSSKLAKVRQCTLGTYLRASFAAKAHAAMTKRMLKTADPTMVPMPTSLWQMNRHGH